MRVGLRAGVGPPRARGLGFRPERDPLPPSRGIAPRGVHLV